MEPRAPFVEPIPQMIGRYQVQSSIGYGAMGAVYKAYDPLIKRTLAIKTIRLDIPRASPHYNAFLERFYHEARISGTLSHPNIVTLYDIGEENHVPYLAMEYVEGETLASMLERGYRFAPERVIALVSQVASAIDYAHARGVIHRDIKPSNLILFDAERVKVTDFGIAKLVDANMTQSGTLLGTPSYMSPEQAMGERLDGRTDIFSLGVCAFEMLAGEQPFPGTNVTSILYKLVNVEPVEPATLEDKGLVPQKWHEVFNRVLAKRPDDRYQSCAAFVQDLEYCLGAWFGAAMAEEAEAAARAGVPSFGDASDAAGFTRPIAQVDLSPAAHGNGSGETALLAALSPAPEPPLPARESSAETINLGRATGPSAAGAIEPAAEPVETVQLRVQPPTPVLREPPLPAAAGGVDKTVLLSAGVSLRGGHHDGQRSESPLAAAPPAPAKAAEKTLVMTVGDQAGSLNPTPAAARTKARTARPLAPAEPPLAAPAPTRPLPVMRGNVRPSPATAPVGAAPAPAAEIAPAPAASAAPGARRALPTGLVVGDGAALVLALLVGTSLVLRSPAAPPPSTTLVAQPEPTPVPEPAPAVTTGLINIETSPPGATVLVNGERRGVSPLEIASLPLGMYEVRATLKGFEPRAQTVTLSADAVSQSLKLTLNKLGPALGTADIAAVPAGAVISIDGSVVGESPLSGHKLRAGSYRVEVDMAGFEPWQGTLVVEAGKTAHLEPVLRAIPKPTPTPVPVEVVDTARVYEESGVDTPAKRVSGGTAAYPKNAPKLRTGERQSVKVTFVVTENGDVADVRVTESAGKLLDEAVMAAVSTWKYTPATKKGIKVKQRTGFIQTFLGG